MDMETILPKVFETTMLGGVLLVMLWVVWGYVKKKDEELTNALTNSNLRLLEMQEKTIQSNNQLSAVIKDLHETILSNNTAIIQHFADLRVLIQINGVNSVNGKKLSAKQNPKG